MDTLFYVEQSATARAERTSRPAFYAAHVGFVVHGIITILLAPLLPTLGALWHLDDAQLGSLFTAQFAGSLTGVLLSGWLVPSRGFRVALGLGYALMAAGVAALASAGWPAGLGCVMLFGVGVGLTITASNVYVGQAQPHRSAAALNILNFAWTVGAIACPWIFVLAESIASREAVLWTLAAASAAVAVWIAGVRWPAAARTAEGTTARLRDVPGAGQLIAALGALFFLYVGSEVAVVGWIVSYSERLSGGERYASVITPSFFFAAVLLMRLAAPLILRVIGERALVRCGIAIGTAGAVGILVSGATGQIMASVTVVGLGFGTVFPLLVAEMAQRFGPATARAASILFALSNVGGAVLPLVVGITSTSLGSLKAGLIVSVVGGVAMLAVHMTTLPGGNGPK